MKARSLGLLCAGSVSRTSLARLPGLTDLLGPVKSASLQAASRATNNLRSGTAVDSYLPVANCQTVLVSVPDDDLKVYLEGLMQERTNWKKRTLLILRATSCGDILQRFRALGASVAWFDALPSSHDKVFIADGDPLALRTLRQLIHRDGVELLEIAPGTRDSFWTATATLTSLHLPMLAAAVELLRRCELPPGVASDIAESLLMRSSRSYLRSGKRSLSLDALDPVPFAFEPNLDDRLLSAVFEWQLQLTRAWLNSSSKS